jgi:hypothetical protein
MENHNFNHKKPQKKNKDVHEIEIQSASSSPSHSLSDSASMVAYSIHTPQRQSSVHLKSHELGYKAP